MSLPRVSTIYGIAVIIAATNFKDKNKINKEGNVIHFSRATIIHENRSETKEQNLHVLRKSNRRVIQRRARGTGSMYNIDPVSLSLFHDQVICNHH